MDLTNVESQVFASQTGTLGTLQSSNHGFTVLNKDNSQFNAKTPNYASSEKKLDVYATSAQSTQPSMVISLSYNQK